MTALVRRLQRDDGVSVLELMIASIVTAVLSAIMLSWVVATLRTEAFNEAEQAALDQMRLSKARLVKELRFATAIDPAADADTLTFFVELGGAPGPDISGEVVTWEIQADGRLLRYVDNDPLTAVEQAPDLVVGSSQFTYDLVDPTRSPVTIEFVADVDQADGPDARSIRTQVHLRNA